MVSLKQSLLVVRMNLIHSARLGGILTAILGVLSLLLLAPHSSAQTPIWSEPVNISNDPTGSWLPDLAVDSTGNVHVIWCETTPLEDRTMKEQVYYSMWDGQTWSTPYDIAPPSHLIVRNAITADAFGNLHLLFGGAACYRDLTICYVQAPYHSGWSPTAWSSPRLLSINGNSYMADIAVDSWVGLSCWSY